MAIDKIIPQYLASDTDEKLVKSVEMTDNLNVRVSVDEEGSGGVVKNIKGTAPLLPKTAGDAFPSGEKRVIGSVENEANKEVLFLLWSRTNNHGIYRIDLTDGKYQKLYEDGVLKFKKYSYAKCDTIVNIDGETLLYWTDNNNPPMKVNVQRLIRGSYPVSLYSGTDEEKLLSLTAAKQPPLSPPSCAAQNNATLSGESLIKEGIYQFAYKYVHTDGEHSALSPYSKAVYSNAQIIDGFSTDGAKNWFNEIKVQVRNTPADVDEIVIYAREGNTGTFYEVDTIDNASNSTVSSVYFRNSNLGKPLSQDEVNKIFDMSPQRAKAQAIAGNRLMYGNYVEGYSNIEPDTTLIANYHKEPPTYDIVITAYQELPIGQTKSNITQLPIAGMDLDFSSVPATVTENAKLTFNVVIDLKELYVYGRKDSNNNKFTDQITIDEDSNELFIRYVKRDDQTDVDIREANVQKIKESSTLAGWWNDLMVGLGVDGLSPAITLDAEPVSVRKVFDISAGTTRSDIMQMVTDYLNNKKAKVFVNPAKEGKRLSVFDHTGVNLLPEKGAFIGSALLELPAEPQPSTNVTRHIFSVKRYDLEVSEFYKDGNRPTDLVDASRLQLTDTRIGTGLDAPNVDILSGGSGIYEKLTGWASFKSGASHKLGIVYADDRGRCSGVQEVGSVAIQHLGSRADENDLHGRASVVMRVKHEAPSWAKKWMPVYAPTSTAELKLMYGTGGAYAQTNNIERLSALSGKKHIYVSLNTALGKDGGYNKTFGADLQYNFEKGDRLRVVKYGNDERHAVNFKIVDQRTLNDDALTNPILSRTSEEAIEATTGEFLVLEDNQDSKFGFSALIGETSKWFDRCIIEVYRPRKAVEEPIYHEIGRAYDINSGAHSDDRVSSSVLCTVESVATNEYTLSSSTEVFAGDIIVTGTTKLLVQNVSTIKDGEYDIYATKTAGATLVASTAYTFTVENPEAVISIEEGDVFYRVKNVFATASETSLYLGTGAKLIGLTEFVEDYSVSDFFKSDSTSIGRPFAHQPEAANAHRASSITYSDGYVQDSDRLGLASFNASLANWLDLDLAYGGVDAIISRGGSLTAIQENKASNIPVNRNLIEFSGGESGLAVSRTVLNNPSYYAGDYGSAGNPESVVERFGVVYYADIKSGVIVRLSADGITPISSKGMEGFFQERLKAVLENSGDVRAVGGFDPDNNEYLLTIEPIVHSNLSVGTLDVGLTSTDDGVITANGMTFVTNTVLWNIINTSWNVFCGNWDDVGNGLVFVDSFFSPLSILVDNSFAGQTGTINVIATDASWTFIAIAQLDLATGELTFPATTCEGEAIEVGAPEEKDAGFTISYKHREGVWGSKYSFQPTNYVAANNVLYSFFDTYRLNQTDPSTWEVDGIAWSHNTNTRRNYFYGRQYNSEIEVASNQNPSMVKVFEAMGIEGGGTWTSVLSTEGQQTTLSEYDTREGNQYSIIKRDTLNSSGHQIYIGEVESVSGDSVTFTAPVNSMPFNINDVLKVANGSVLTATGAYIESLTDRKTIKCTAPVGGIVAGDSIFAEHSSLVDGDPMRGVYLKLKLTSTDSTPWEVHAITVSHDRSRLHNDRVN